jgi:hypothetical protein
VDLIPLPRLTVQYRHATNNAQRLVYEDSEMDSSSFFFRPNSRTIEFVAFASRTQLATPTPFPHCRNRRFLS